MDTYLAIDYGTQRIGLARSFGTLAEPLFILQNDETLFTELLRVLSEEGITKIIVGVSENVMAEKTKVFAVELKKYTDLPIHFTDETLSSASVHEKLYDKNKKAHKGQYKGPVDHLAAAHFLQEYLDYAETE
ncbi:hypothetical protein BH10PAT2_BH10PAT2_0060 [soil metagenome]